MHSPTKADLGFAATKCKSIDVEWNNLTVTASLKKKVIENGRKVTKQDDKIILNRISGSIKHGKFTAIMGPSGEHNFSKSLLIVRMR